MKIRTATGSLYELTDFHIRRIEQTHDMRRDGDWLKLFNQPEPRVGEPMVLILEPLGEGDVTVRTTSRVIEVTGA